MFKSKKTSLIYSVIMLALVFYLIVDIAMNWNELMQTDRMRLFTRILLSILFSINSINYFLKWRNHGKPKVEEE